MPITEEDFASRAMRLRHGCQAAHEPVFVGCGIHLDRMRPLIDELPGRGVVFADKQTAGDGRDAVRLFECARGEQESIERIPENSEKPPKDSRLSRRS